MSAAPDKSAPLMDAEIERLLVRERNRSTLTPRHHEQLAMRIRSTASRLRNGAIVSAPWWAAWLRPALALAFLLLATGGALAVTGVWRPWSRRQPVATVPAVRAPEAVAPSAALREEIDLLSHARQALAERAFERAAEHLAQHARRFPAGALIEEREGLSVMLLWHVGDHANANAATRRFAERYPSSPLNRPIRALASEPPRAPPKTGR